MYGDCDFHHTPQCLLFNVFSLYTIPNIPYTNRLHGAYTIFNWKEISDPFFKTFTLIYSFSYFSSSNHWDFHGNVRGQKDSNCLSGTFLINIPSNYTKLKGNTNGNRIRICNHQCNFIVMHILIQTIVTKPFTCWQTHIRSKRFKRLNLSTVMSYLL